MGTSVKGGMLGRVAAPPAFVKDHAAAVATAAEPASAPRYAGLTRLRLLFIGWVLVYHLELALRALGGLPVVEPVVRRGYLGVDGFFLLSGFALWLGYRARPPRGLQGYGRFLARRLAKIMPLHTLALLALAGLVGAAVAAGVTIRDPERFSAADFALQFLLVNTWETTDRLAWNYPSWALSAEWAGYLAFPAVFALAGRTPAPLLPALAALALAALFLLGARDPSVGLNLTVNLGLARFFPEFLLGLAVGRLCTERRIGAGAALVGALGLPLGLALRIDALVVAGLAALIAAAWLREAARPAGANHPRDLLHRLGEASFGVYMVWVFIEAALVLLLRAADPAQPARIALMALALAANLAAGRLVWRLIEVPANRWLLARIP